MTARFLFFCLCTMTVCQPWLSFDVGCSVASGGLSVGVSCGAGTVAAAVCMRRGDADGDTVEVNGVVSVIGGMLERDVRDFGTGRLTSGMMSDDRGLATFFFPAAVALNAAEALTCAWRTGRCSAAAETAGLAGARAGSCSAVVWV